MPTNRTNTALNWLERRLVYFPDRRRVVPASLGLDKVEEVELAMGDGVKLVAWRAGAADRPLVLYLHGNAGGLVTRASRIPLFTDAGHAVFMPSYRSFSGSGGEPSELANVSDAEAVLKTLIGEGRPAKDIVLYGESLGSGIAIQLAVKYQVRALVLEAPYSSVLDIARWRTPLLPVERLMQDRYDSVQHIARVRAPVLVVHGERDGIVPIRYGRTLFAAANEPKRFIAFPRAGHVNLYAHGAFEEIAKFIAVSGG